MSDHNRDIFTVINSNDIAGLAEMIADRHQLDATNDNSYDETPLAYAARRGHLQMVEMLIASGADVNACDRDGDSCLASALYGGNKTDLMPILERLIAAGADPAQRAHNGKNAFDRVAGNTGECREEDVLSILRNVIPSSLCVIFNRKSGHVPLEEVYMFDELERVTYVRDAEGRVNALFREPFSAIATLPSLRAAYDEHVKRGGTVPETEVFGNGFASQFKFNP